MKKVAQRALAARMDTLDGFATSALEGTLALIRVRL
jgi:hypothetical protein